MADTPFALNPQLTSIAIGYQNTEDMLIADRVMPRVDTAKKFNWTNYAKEQAYTVPESSVGRKSAPNEVTFEGDQVEDSVKDYAFDTPVPMEDIEAFADMPKPPSGGGPIAPEAFATMMLSNLLLLAREIRVARTIFNAANYDAALQQTLSGTSQWSDYANSDPISDILAALDAPLIRPNTITFGQEAWTVVRQHPKVVQAIYKTQQSAGTVNQQAFADLMEVKQILVGSGRLNTAKKGQTATFSRVWGKHCSLTYTSQQAAQMFMPTFAWTAAWGGKFAGTFLDPKKGIKGSLQIRVGERVKEIVSAPQSAYFFQNVIA